MARRFGGVGILLVSATILVGGLVMLAGDGAGGPESAPSGPVGTTTTTTGVSTASTITPTRPTSTTTTTTTVTTATTTTTTATTAPTSTVETTTTEVPAPVPGPLPIAVTASQDVVGAGGVVTFTGRCPVDDGTPSGPVVLWVVGQATQVVATGITAAEWTYDWVAPVDEAEFESFTFQFWCGDPIGFQRGYPAELQLVVDMVASAPPIVPTVEPVIIPATG